MSLEHYEKSGTKRLRDTLKYNILCNDGKVVSPKRYDMPDRFRRTDGLVHESRTVYSKTQNCQRFGERCISTPSLNTKNQKHKRRVREIEISTDDSITAEGGKDKRKTVSRSLYCEQREEAEIEEVLKKLQKLSKLVRTNTVVSHLGIEGRVWNDNLLWVSGECLQRSDEETLKLNNRTITKGKYTVENQTIICMFNYISIVDLYLTLPIFYARISCKVSRIESFIDSISREGTELEVVLKRLGINRFKRVASKDDKVRRSQAKRRMAGKTPGSMEENMLTPELNTPLKLVRLYEMQDGLIDMATVSSTLVHNLAKRKAVKRGAAFRSATSGSVDDSSKRRKVTFPVKSQVVLEESVKIVEGADLRLRFEVEIGLMEEQCRAKAREKGVTVVEDEFKKLRYTKVEILAFRKGNYEEKEIMDEEEVEEMEDGLNAAEKIIADNQETINQYEDRFDDNMKLSLKLEEAKSQVEDKTATLLSRDLALNQLLSELVELKERAASGSRHDAELAEYRIRALNDKIYDMKCNIRAMNEQLLKREIDLDTARTDLAMSEANFEKLSSIIVSKDLELRNSPQICDSLIARFDRLKADLCCLKERKAKNRANLVEVQAKNKSLVDDLAHVRRNLRRVVQCDKEMNKRINQLCARITDLERELRAREMNYEKDLKLELDKRDGEITSGEGSREMKEFLHQKEELVENMRIELTNSRQKSIDLMRQMSERIDQLATELTESKACRLRDIKRAAVTHQSFKELVVQEQDKCDGEALYQRQLSALVAFFVEEIKF
ncbi:hypothetical protein GIB67_040249 [Kingdonia uniflora]|uniref:Uncharacterized protein n=1 Tax=Kingdonia uniflora TaxID=39325 RepID=A0A7J7MV04_9MAGN|nr:hypothetical protein GIB67_040249 [Kingdonia uniflora]